MSEPIEQRDTTRFVNAVATQARSTPWDAVVVTVGNEEFTVRELQTVVQNYDDLKRSVASDRVQYERDADRLHAEISRLRKLLKE